MGEKDLQGVQLEQTNDDNKDGGQSWEQVSASLMTQPTGDRVTGKPEDSMVVAGVIGDRTKEDGPAPETWQYDKSGKLLKAGDAFSANYDQNGKLNSVTLADQSFARTGNPGEVLHTYRDADGRTQTEKLQDITQFTAEPWDAQTPGGPSRGVSVEVKTDDGRSGMSAAGTIWDPESSRVWRELQWDDNGIKNSTSAEPHPATWERNNDGHVVKAGDRVEASYNPNGELERIRVGDDTYERTSNPGEVRHTYRTSNGLMADDVITDVTSFEAKEHYGRAGGTFAGVDVQVKFGTSSLESHYQSVWESPQQKAFLDRFWGTTAKDQ